MSDRTQITIAFSLLIGVIVVVGWMIFKEWPTW